MRPTPDPIGPGQESVWSYPRPPIAEATAAEIVIVHREVVIASTRRAVRTLETSHPPTYYVPRNDIREDALLRAGGSSDCERKGDAIYWDVVFGAVSAAVQRLR